MQPIGVLHQAKPCFFEQVFGDIAASGQAREEREEAAVELRVHEVERVRIASAKASDEREFGFPVHSDLTQTESYRDTAPLTTRSCHDCPLPALYPADSDIDSTEVHVEVLRNAPLVILLGLLVSLSPLVMGVAFAIRPNERKLALMRPLSLAAIFAAVSSVLVGIINVLVGLGRVQVFDSQSFRAAFVNMAEVIVPTFVGFACLTVAWLCVAMGMRKLS